MSNLGGYQDIVVEAHKAGGTDIWLDSIKKDAYNAGVADTKNALIVPLLATGAGIAIAGNIAYKKIAKCISDKKEKKILSRKEAIKAEKSLKQELDVAVAKFKKKIEDEQK